MDFWFSESDIVRRSLESLATLLCQPHVRVIDSLDAPGLAEAGTLYAVAPVSCQVGLKALRKRLHIYKAHCTCVVKAMAHGWEGNPPSLVDLSRHCAEKVLHDLKNAPPRTRSRLAPVVSDIIEPLLDLGLLEGNTPDTRFVVTCSKKANWTDDDHLILPIALEAIWKQLRA